MAIALRAKVLPGPWMVGRYGPAIQVGADGVASRWTSVSWQVSQIVFTLWRSQFFIALVRPLVVGHRGSGMMSVTLYDDAATALAGVEVAQEGLLPDPVCAAPAGITVEPTIGLSLGGAWMRALLPVTYARWAVEWGTARHRAFVQYAFCRRSPYTSGVTCRSGPCVICSPMR